MDNKRKNKSNNLGLGSVFYNKQRDTWTCAYYVTDFKTLNFAPPFSEKMAFCTPPPQKRGDLHPPVFSINLCVLTQSKSSTQGVLLFALHWGCIMI